MKCSKTAFKGYLYWISEESGQILISKIPSEINSIHPLSYFKTQPLICEIFILFVGGPNFFFNIFQKSLQKSTPHTLQHYFDTQPLICEILFVVESQILKKINYSKKLTMGVRRIFKLKKKNVLGVLKVL